jgi:hypothetical protein
MVRAMQSRNMPVLACGAAGKRIRRHQEHMLLDYSIKDGVGASTMYPLEAIQTIIADRAGVHHSEVWPTESLSNGSLAYTFFIGF